MHNIQLTIDNEEGDEIPLVCLHGFLETKEMWGNLHLFFDDNPIYCFDIPGHGKSHLPENTVCGIDQLARMILEALTLLNVNSFIVIGHSMGGYIALEMLKQKKNSISKIILLNSNFISDTEQKKKDRWRSIQLLQHRPKMYYKQAFETLFWEPERWEGLIRSLGRKAQEMKMFALHYSLEAMMSRNDQSWLVKENQDKVFMLQGEKDTMFMDPNENVEVLKLSQWITFSESKHMSFFEQNEDVLIEIEKIIKKK